MNLLFLFLLVIVTGSLSAQPALWDFTLKASNAGIGRVQYASTNDTSSVEDRKIIFTNTITSGSTLIVGLRVGNSAAASVVISDTLGNTWTFVTNVVEGANSVQFIYYASNSVAGTDTVNFTWSNPGSVRIIGIEYRGLAVNAPLDKFATASGSSTTLDSSSVTTTSGTELLLGFSNYNNSVDLTAGSGYAIIVQLGQRYVAEERFVTATGTYTADGTWSSTTPWSGAIATFKK
jgi:hypothetical protein